MEVVHSEAAARNDLWRERDLVRYEAKILSVSASVSYLPLSREKALKAVAPGVPSR